MVVYYFVVTIYVCRFVLKGPSGFVGGSPGGRPLPNDFLKAVCGNNMIIPVVRALLLAIVTLDIRHCLTVQSTFNENSLIGFITGVGSALTTNSVGGTRRLYSGRNNSMTGMIASALEGCTSIRGSTALSGSRGMLTVRGRLRRTATLRLPVVRRGLPIVNAVAALNALVKLLNAMVNVVHSFTTLSTNNNASSVTLSRNVSRTLVGATFNVLANTLTIVSCGCCAGGVSGLACDLSRMNFSVMRAFTTSRGWSYRPFGVGYCK